MPNKKGIVFVMIGAVLILSALSLYLYNRTEDENAGQEAESLLREMQAAIFEHPAPKPSQPAITRKPDTSEAIEQTEPVDPTMREEIIQGYACIGYLSIPMLGLELPVLSQWDAVRLQTAPCRQFGSTKTDDLVIAAHNYIHHFGTLKDLVAGDWVYFTDMDGNRNTYVVSSVEALEADDVEVLLSRGSALVLYTCTKGGAKRVTVFCNRAEETVETIDTK